MAVVTSQSSASLKLQAHGQLRLARIAHTVAQETIKVKQRRGGQRIDIVLVVESIEQFNSRNNPEALAKAERTVDAEIKGEEAIVFQQMVAATVDCRAASRW